MQCSLPPPLTEDQLSDVLDGIADPKILEHVRQCDFCSARVEAARQLETSLHGQLYRWDAPTSDQLADYVLGLLDEPARAQIDDYLRNSPSTRAEVETLRAYLDIDALPSESARPQPAQNHHQRTWHGLGRVPRLEEIVATLLPGSLQPALRGEGGIARGELTAEGRGVTIFVEYVVEGGSCTITGQVMTSNPDDWNGGLAQLFADNSLAATTTLDTAGEFKLTNVAPGTYDLRIASEHNQVIVVHELRIDL